MNVNRPHDGRLLRALSMFNTVRIIDPEIPAHVVDALLRIHAASGVGNEAMTTRSLLDALEPTPNTTAFRALERLKNWGLVEGVGDKVDKRIVRLHTTAKGKSVVDDILEHFTRA